LYAKRQEKTAQENGDTQTEETPPEDATQEEKQVTPPFPAATSATGSLAGGGIPLAAVPYPTGERRDRVPDQNGGTVLTSGMTVFPFKLDFLTRYLYFECSYAPFFVSQSNK
jgi:hypothetical protein